MWCVAEFSTLQGDTEGKEIASVHTNWINGNKCFWPPFWKHITKYSAALKNGDKPDPHSWPAYEFRVVGNKYFDNFKDCEKFLPIAELASELSGNETFKSRSTRRRQKRNFKSDSEADSESSFKENTAEKRVTPKAAPARKKKNLVGTPTISTPPAFPAVSSSITPVESTFIVIPEMKQTDTRVQAVDQEDPDVYIPNNPDLAELTSQRESLSVIGPCTAQLSAASGSSEISAIIRPPAATGTQLAPGRNPQNILPSGSGTVASQISLPKTGLPVPKMGNENFDLKGFVQAINSNQQLILIKLDLLLETTGALLGNRPVVSSTSSSPPSMTLPFNSIEDFKKFEKEMLADLTKKQSLVNVLATTGGNQGNQIVHRVMSELMTDELMLNYTFKGHREKESFCKMFYMTCVCDAVMSQPKGKAMTKKEIEHAVDYWLRKASTRISKKMSRLSKGLQNFGTKDSDGATM